MVKNNIFGMHAFGIVAGITLFVLAMIGGANAAAISVDDGVIVSKQVEQSFNPQAYFSLRIGSGVKTNNDSITSGWYSMGQGYSLSIENINDTTNTVLGNLQYTLQADNISSVDYPEYSNWNSSYAKWIFPEKFSLNEDAGLRVDAGKDFSNGYLPMKVSRKFNKSIFIEDGYQLAEFNFTFDDKNFIPHGGEIHALEISSMNASLLLDTFYTDAPLNENRPFSIKNEHAIDFLFNTSKLQEKKTYNISIVIKVDLKNNNPILYKPYYVIWIIYNATQAPDQIGNTATIPNEMLTEDVHFASVSTNISNRWYITQYYIRTAGLNGIMQNLYQFIRDLKIEPTESINASNPLRFSAIVSGENLSSVNFGIVDLNNLLNDNMTLLGVYINSSGLNGKFSASWYANSFSIKNGNTQEIVTVGRFTQSYLSDYYGVFGFFKKNDTTDEVNAILWFDRTTGVLSKISKYDEAFSPLSIENGLSDFKIVKFKFLKGWGNDPSSVNGSTYTLFNIGSSNNPSLISSAVPNGVYRAFIRVMDKFGNNQGEFKDVEVSAGSSAGTVVSISNTTTTPNSNITRSIMVENVNNLAAATIWLTYDPNVVNVLSVSAGDFGGVAPNIDNAIGKVTMSAISTTAKSGSITFANVQLKAIGSVTATSPLTLTVSSFNDQNGAAIPYTIKNGTFTISSVIKGDVNSDSSVTIVDALFVAQYTVGSRTLSSQQIAAADVNNDGQVTIVDALFIAQYTVGLRQL